MIKPKSLIPYLFFNLFFLIFNTVNSQCPSIFNPSITVTLNQAESSITVTGSETCIDFTEEQLEIIECRENYLENAQTYCAQTYCDQNMGTSLYNLCVEHCLNNAESELDDACGQAPELEVIPTFSFAHIHVWWTTDSTISMAGLPQLGRGKSFAAASPWPSFNLNLPTNVPPTHAIPANENISWCYALSIQIEYSDGSCCTHTQQECFTYQ